MWSRQWNKEEEENKRTKKLKAIIKLHDNEIQSLN